MRHQGGGRRVSLTVEMVDEIAEAVEAGVPLEAVAEARGMSAQTLTDWLSVGAGASTWRSGADVEPETGAVCESLYRSVSIARARREEQLARRLGQLAETGTRDDTVRLKATLSILETHPSYRGRWGRTVTVQQTGRVEHQHLHVELSADEARAMAERLRARELPDPLGGNGSGGVDQD